MPRNGELPNCQRWYISDVAFPAYIEVSFFQEEVENLIIFIFSDLIGDLLSEDEVLEWLRKNRFRQPELNIFMYALIALAVAFVVYTAFLLQCFKPAPPPPVQHPKQS